MVWVRDVYQISSITSPIKSRCSPGLSGLSKSQDLTALHQDFLAVVSFHLEAFKSTLGKIKETEGKQIIQRFMKLHNIMKLQLAVSSQISITITVEKRCAFALRSTDLQFAPVGQ